MEKEFIHPETINNFPEAFTQVVTYKGDGVKTVLISGQVAVDAEGKAVGKGDLAVQADQAFKNFTLALAAAGASAEDVVKLNVYIVDLDGEKVGTVGAAMGKYFTHKDRPASTWIGVQALVSRRYMLEVEGTAIVAD